MLLCQFSRYHAQNTTFLLAAEPCLSYIYQLLSVHMLQLETLCRAQEMAYVHCCINIEMALKGCGSGPTGGKV